MIQLPIFFLYYFGWHYGPSMTLYFLVWGNLCRFVIDFFSMNLLIKSFFSPFRRLSEKIVLKNLEFEKIASAIVVNIMMRLVGIMVRTFFILFGLLFLLVVIFFGACFFLVWFMLPLAIFIAFSAGLSIILV